MAVNFGPSQRMEMCSKSLKEELRMIYGAINDNGTWRTSYNIELYMVYDEPDIVKVIETRRLRWLGHFCKMYELGLCRKLTVLKPEDT